MKKWLVLLVFFPALASARIAPPFKAETMEGRSISLKSELKPDRFLFLSFWASWCGNCLDELKHLTASLKAEKEVPLDLLTINVDDGDTAAEIKPTLRYYHFSFPVILDPKREIFSKFRDDFSLPYSLLIGSNGQILETFSGYSENLFAKIKAISLPLKKAL